MIMIRFMTCEKWRVYLHDYECATNYFNNILQYMDLLCFRIFAILIFSVRVVFLGFTFKTALRIFPIFCLSVEDNRANRLSQMVVFEKNSQSRILGDYVINKVMK